MIIRKLELPIEWPIIHKTIEKVKSTINNIEPNINKYNIHILL